MPDNETIILSTRTLSQELIEEAADAGITVDCISFIETEPILTIETQQEIERALIQSTTVVFTSMSAVDAVATLKDELTPDWRIYCTGNTTKELAAHYFDEKNIMGTASSAAELAELIIEDGETEEVIFFCGDQRREELPALLKEHDIEVNEIIVYQTIPVPHKIEKTYHGILFFSPSAVATFFSTNKLPSSTVILAIGTTTAAEIKKYCNNTVITGKQPGKEQLLRLAIEFFAA